MYVSRLEKAFQKFFELNDENGQLVGNPSHQTRQPCFLSNPTNLVIVGFSGSAYHL